jgi:hypothetical protein
MRGSKAKAERTKDRPNPGRKHGGGDKDEVKAKAAIDGSSPLGRRFRKDRQRELRKMIDNTRRSMD